MRKEFNAKTYLLPSPVLIIGTYDNNKKANVMNAAWGGTYDDKQIFICLSTDHKTTQNIELNKEFTVAFAEVKNEKESDYFGVVSANEGVDKLAHVNFHEEKSNKVNAPIILEYSLTLECRVASLNKDESGETTYVVADIVGISADESILTNGNIDSSKLHLITFDPISYTYREIGNVIGNAFKDGVSIK